MVFLDSNDLIDQFKLGMKLKNLEKQKTYYLEKIEEVNKDRQELFSNIELLEKFAREKYFMKRKSEDIYILVE
jgi:cell division protein DivIC